MYQLFYTTGQAAKVLGVTQHIVRRLAGAGLLKAEASGGGHLRIPGNEIDRLKREGIPPLPQIQKRDDHEDSFFESVASRPVRDIRPADSEAVRGSFDDVTIAENSLKKRKIEFEAVELQDRFEAHDELDRKHQSERERAAEVMKAAADAIQKRQRWEHEWEEYAIRQLPSDVSASARLGLPDHVSEALQKTDPEHSQFFVQQLVDAAIEKCIAPWRRAQQVQKAIEKAVDQLPSGAKSLFNPTQWQVRAKHAARARVRELGDDATIGEVEVFARQAIEPIIQEFEHQKACKQIVSGLHISGGTSVDQEEGKELVREALLHLPVGASARQMENARDEALKPLNGRIALRQDQELRQSVISTPTLFPWDFSKQSKEAFVEAIQRKFTEVPAHTPRAVLEGLRQQILQLFLDAHTRHKKKQQLIDGGLREIYRYLRELDSKGLYEGPASTTESKLKEPIRRRLENRLTGNESGADVDKKVRLFVRNELGIGVKP
jgi:excisionase family DNA binding protein